MEPTGLGSWTALAQEEEVEVEEEYDEEERDGWTPCPMDHANTKQMVQVPSTLWHMDPTIPNTVALTSDDLHSLMSCISPNGLDNLLLMVIVFTAFHALLRLGEITQSDNVHHHSSMKVTMRHTVEVTLSSF